MAIRPHYVSFMIPSLLAEKRKLSELLRKPLILALLDFSRYLANATILLNSENKMETRGGDSTETFLEKAVLKVSDQIIKKQNKKVKRGTVYE